MTKKQERQQRAALRLDAQILSGVKPVKKANWAGILKEEKVPLEEKDIERIKLERAKLKARAGK